MNLFARAAAGLNLTPGERAVLKLVKGAALAALVTVLPALDSLLNGQTVLSQRNIVIACGAFAVAFLMALSKYYTAQGDAPLGSVLTAAAQGVAAHTGASAAPLPPAVPPLPSDPVPVPVPLGPVHIAPATLTPPSTTNGTSPAQVIATSQTNI